MIEMVNEKFDKEFLEMHKLVIKTSARVSDMHKMLMGNGQPGLFAEFNQVKGGLLLAKFLAGGGLLFSLIAVYFTIFVG